MVLDVLQRVDIETRLAPYRKSLRWLAKEVGVDHQSLINWLDGENYPRDPKKWDEIEAAVEGLKNTIAKPRMAVAEVVSALPLWPNVSAGTWMSPEEESIDWFELPGFLVKRNRVVTKVLGDSMNPRIRSGDYWVFQLDPVPRFGRIGLARNEHGESTVKIIKRDPLGNVSLSPLNPECEPPTADTLLCTGYLVAILKDYDSGRGNIEWDDGGIGP